MQIETKKGFDHFKAKELLPSAARSCCSPDLINVGAEINGVLVALPNKNLHHLV